MWLCGGRDLSIYHDLSECMCVCSWCETVKAFLRLRVANAFLVCVCVCYFKYYPHHYHVLYILIVREDPKVIIM